VISGDLGRMGDYWLLNLRRVNVRKAIVMQRVGRRIKGDVNLLIEAISSSVDELFGKSSEPAFAPAPAPAVKAAPAPAVKADPAQAKPEEIKKEPVKEVKEEPSVAVESRNGKTGDLSIAAFSTFFPGAALVVLGGVGQWQMVKAQDDEKAGKSGAKDRFATWKGVAAAGYAIGGAAMATGIALWIVEATQTPTAQDAATVSFGASPLGDGFTACLAGRW